MPLQNRVTPTGEIIATPARGMFTGNRGIIHDPVTKTLLRKRWSCPAWLICVIEFRGRRRKVMGGRSWTELFFLDEATAFAAGHRPCFYCRRDDANRFRSCWEKGNRVERPACARDRCGAASRTAGERQDTASAADADAKLPEGTMVQAGDDSFLVVGGRTLKWSPAGYISAAGLPKDAMLLTPPSTVRAFAAGYRPALHPSANI